MGLNLNRAYIGGRLTKKPELKQFDNGKRVCEFCVVTSMDWTDKATGERNSKPTFHNIKVWGGMIDACMKCLDKGSEVIVEGRIEKDKYESGNGEKKEYVSITAKYVNFAGRRVEDNNLQDDNHNL